MIARVIQLKPIRRERKWRGLILTLIIAIPWGLILGAILTALAGCGTHEEPEARPTYPAINVPDAEPLVAAWYARMTELGLEPAYVRSIDPVTVQQRTTNLGACLIGEPRTVLINMDNWPTLQPTRRRVLIWHELGHCGFGLPHADVPTEIMSPFLAPEYVLERDWDEMVERYILDLTSDTIVRY